MATKKCEIRPLLSRDRANSGKMRNLEGSGIDVILTTTVYAIIGAIALQRGGAVAAEVARERVLKRLGVL